MKNLLFKWSGSTVLAFTMLASISCTKDDLSLDTPAPLVQLELVTSSGSSINPNGEWESGCAMDLGNNLSEVFTFAIATITIDINIYEDSNCTNLSGQDEIIISAESAGTYEATLNGNPVLANKIYGTFTRQNNSQTSEFRQAIYVDDSGDNLQFYHGRFSDDGGALTADGYPLEIIPIAFQKK